jgi:hypothetical protein
MAERRFSLTEPQLSQLIWAHVRVALDENARRYEALLLRRPQVFQGLRTQDADWLPDDAPNWAPAPPRPAHQGNGRQQTRSEEDGPSDVPAW